MTRVEAYFWLDLGPFGTSDRTVSVTARWTVGLDLMKCGSVAASQNKKIQTVAQPITVDGNLTP